MLYAKHKNRKHEIKNSVDSVRNITPISLAIKQDKSYKATGL